MDFTTLATTSILPVDLNAFILKVCLRTLLNRFFAKLTGDYNTAENFLKTSRARQKAIKSVFWNAKMGQWLDYWLNDTTCEVES